MNPTTFGILIPVIIAVAIILVIVGLMLAGYVKASPD